MREVIAPLWCTINRLRLPSETDECLRNNKRPRCNKQRDEHPLPKHPEHPTIAYMALRGLKLRQLVCSQEEQRQHETRQPCGTRARDPHDPLDRGGKVVVPCCEVQTAVCSTGECHDGFQDVALHVDAPEEREAWEVWDMVANVDGLADEEA